MLVGMEDESKLYLYNKLADLWIPIQMKDHEDQGAILKVAFQSNIIAWATTQQINIGCYNDLRKDGSIICTIDSPVVEDDSKDTLKPSLLLQKSL